MHEYQHLLRGRPRSAWWRSLLAFLLVVAFLLLAVLLVGGGLWLAGLDFEQAAPASGENTVAVFALTNFLLAALIPIAMLSTRIAHGAGAGYLSSVVGGLRWKWMLRCVAITAPVFIVFTALGLLLEWPQSARPAQWGLLLLLVLVGTPLQAAGEEYVFRGLILQNIGVWFRNPRTAIWVATAVSTVVFALVHGSTDPWILLDLGIGAAGCCILVWRTGGLEAAIVLHAVNNVAGMVASLVFGGWGEDFVRAGSRGKPMEPLMTLAVTSIVVALVLRKAGVERMQRVYQPAAEPLAGTAAQRRRILTLPRVAVSIVLLANLWAAGANLPQRIEVRPPRLRYADMVTPMGVTQDGCLQGRRFDSLPLEIRGYATRELVGDDVRLTIGEIVITGRNGVFQFPLSAQLITINPNVWVVQADGKRMDYYYQFLGVTLQYSGTCAPIAGIKSSR